MYKMIQTRNFGDLFFQEGILVLYLWRLSNLHRKYNQYFEIYLI